VNPDNLLDTTSLDDRAGCYQVSRKLNRALTDFPTWTTEHQQAVAAVERAIRELQQAKDRKIGRIRTEPPDLS